MEESPRRPRLLVENDVGLDCDLRGEGQRMDFWKAVKQLAD